MQIFVEAVVIMKGDADLHRIEDVIHCQMPNGRYPTKEFIDSLPKAIRAKVYGNLKLLKGLPIGVDIVQIKQLRGKCLEYRIKTKDGPMRIFFYIDSNRIAVLVHAASKKDEASHQRNIEIAMSRIP